MIPSFTRNHTGFMGAADNRLDADVFGDNGPPVLLLHGGGQTRHAWRSTAEKLASKGYTAYALDQRGHGTSEWVANGAYEFWDFSADLKLVATEITRRSGVKPIVVGASLGGIAALLGEGEPKRANDAHLFSALCINRPIFNVSVSNKRVKAEDGCGLIFLTADRPKTVE